MCNRYEYEGSFEKLSEHYGAAPIGALERKSPAFPKYLVPGLIRNKEGIRELHPMQFAFSTPGMKTPFIPGKNRNNARIESAHIPPWRDAFRESRCVIPLTAFHEPCYWGEETEQMKVYFHRPDNKMLNAAGLYREWMSPEGGPPLLTMSMLIGPAMPYVMERGHERQPIFISDDGLDEWLAPAEYSTDRAREILREFFADPELTHRCDGELTEKSWRSNQANRLSRRDNQIAELGRCKHSCGF